MSNENFDSLYRAVQGMSNIAIEKQDTRFFAKPSVYWDNFGSGNGF